MAEQKPQTGMSQIRLLSGEASVQFDGRPLRICGGENASGISLFPATLDLVTTVSQPLLRVHLKPPSTARGTIDLQEDAVTPTAVRLQGNYLPFLFK